VRDIPEEQLLPFDKFLLLAPCFVQAQCNSLPPSNSIFLFFPGHGGEPVETFCKPVKIEGFILFQHVKNLSRDDAPINRFASFSE